MKIDKMNRRAFLQGACGALLSIPFIGMSNSAFAQAVAAKRRLISLTLMSGTARPVWFPQVQATDMNLVGNQYKAARLSALIAKYGQISPVFSDSRWQLFNDKLNLYDGLDGNYFTGHTRTGILAGESVGDRSTRTPPQYASIDYLVSQKIYDQTPSQRLVHLGVRSGNPWGGTTPSFSNSQGVIAEIPSILDPVIAFNSLFKDFTPPPGQGDAATYLARLRAQRKSILDFVLEDFNRTIASTKISSTERQKLESHADNIRDLEQRVTNVEQQRACTLPTKPAYNMFETSEANILKNSIFNQGADASLALDLMIDIMVTAIKCGLTQVGTLQLDAGNSALGGFLPGVNTDNHDLSHDKDAPGAAGDAVRNQVRIVQNFYMSKTLDLVEKLNVVENGETGATYLDNTLIFGGNEMGCWNHREWCLPAFTISGLPEMNSGHYIDYRTLNLIQANYVSDATDFGVEYHGRDYNSALIGVMQVMGLTPADWEKPNVAGYGAYNFRKDWYSEGTANKGIITPGRRSAPPFMLKA